MDVRHLRNGLVGLVCAAIVLAGVYALFPAQQVKVKGLSLDGGALKYDGQVKQAVYDGKGDLRFKNGDRYKGEFKAGEFSGQGQYISHEGWTFTGDFLKGQITGSGSLKTKRQTYTGEFKNGVYQRGTDRTTTN